MSHILGGLILNHVESFLFFLSAVLRILWSLTVQFVTDDMLCWWFILLIRYFWLQPIEWSSINFLYDFCKHTSFTVNQHLENRPFIYCTGSHSAYVHLSLYFKVPLPFSKVIWHTRCIQNKICDVMQWNTVLFVIKTCPVHRFRYVVYGPVGPIVDLASVIYNACSSFWL